MDVTNGNYYRRKIDGATVKVLYDEVWDVTSTPSECACHFPRGVVYRLDDDEYPHRREFVPMRNFLMDFEEKP
jgi:hypothetical protein